MSDNSAGRDLKAQPERISEEEFSRVATSLAVRFIDGLRKAAIAQGLDEMQASRIALQTVTGSAALAQSSRKPLDELIAAVASPGGTTQAGLAVLNANNAINQIVAGAFAEMGVSRRGGDWSCPSPTSS
jgi:pyrroline-5-carboxylate reductase